jgi:hypothetical protein
MTKLVTAFAALAFALSASVNGAMAQDQKAGKDGGKATMKVVAENPKTRAFEVTYAPGAENASVPSSSVRVIRALAGGTLQRTYSDGKKENIVYKTGDVRINESSPAYTTKNIGKKVVKLYVVQIK